MPSEGFELELTRKQRFFLYLSVVLPDLDLVQRLWVAYKEYNHYVTLQFYENISPFRPHPCADGCIFGKVAGIDPDMLMMYIQPRKKFLASVKMIGHPYFICQIKRTKAELEDNVNYFDALMNEEQVKLSKLNKVRVLNRVIMYLSPEEQGFDDILVDLMHYLIAFFNMYKETKVLQAYPLAIDKHGILLRFE